MSLSQLATCSPRALRDRYLDGVVPERSWLGERVAGKILSFGVDPFPRLSRPVLRLYDDWLGQFQGKSFEDDGRRGANRIQGHDRLCFACEVRSSFVDGQPTMQLDYDLPDNSRLVRPIIDELRRVDADVAIGPSALRVGRRHWIAFWYGICVR